MNANVDRRVGAPDAPRELQMQVDGERGEADSRDRSTGISPAHGVSGDAYGVA